MSGVIDFVNQAKTRVRTARGEMFLLSGDNRQLSLLPGDNVEFELRSRSRRSHRPADKQAHVVGVKRALEHLVVVQIIRSVRRSTNAVELLPIGLPGIGTVQISAKLAPSQWQSKYAFVKISLAPKNRTNATVWNLVEFISELNTSAEVANAVAMSRYGLSDDWPAAVLEEVNRISPKIGQDTLASRQDLRNIPFVTIDPPGAKDHDDAIFCERFSADVYRLVVAIADVSHYVEESSKINDEAYQRGTSIYLQETSLPMLPARLSGDLCSLRPGLDRLALSCDMRVNLSGDIVSFEFATAVIRSRLRLSYDEVSPADVEKYDPDIQSSLCSLLDLHQCFAVNRKNRNVLDLEIPAPILHFDANAEIASIDCSKRQLSHSLVEEVMLAANVCAARFISENYPQEAMYRVHDAPTDSSAEEFGALIKGLGLNVRRESDFTLADYAHILGQTHDNRDLAAGVHIHLLRSLSTAIYSRQRAPHFALNYPLYTHFTSPIRRYPDLIVHRMIKNLLKKNNRYYPGVPLRKIAADASYRERRAEACAREVTKWLVIGYMKNFIGEVFAGVVVDVKRFGLFVQLDNPYVDGLAAVESLGSEYFWYDNSKRQLIGEKSGRTYRIGMRVEVWLIGVDQELGHIDFELTDVPAARGRRSHEKRRRKK